MMSDVRNRSRSRREHGAVGVEYALLIGLVSLTMVAAVVLLGGTFVAWVSSLVTHVGHLLG